VKRSLVLLLLGFFIIPDSDAKPPYSPSPVIKSVRFAPTASIIRKATGSDNWPMTWADDGDIYASYGDGWGFEPRIPQKVSQGFAKIVGSPEQFVGVNIRSSSGERYGDGAKGAKASGMLMAGGVLYGWIRNTGNATLAWSNDRGATWEWGFKFKESFGSPSFLNFGKNYEGARDEYVYVYSQDGPSAYESNDGLILARCPQSRIKDASSYQFFAGMDASAQPQWTPSLADRKHVFVYPHHCQRVDAVYHPGIKRFLLALAFNHEGGWGLFDAPEPWGPWTAAYNTESWDLPGTHGYRIPAKWIDPNDNSFYLVFSGVGINDAFCVRKVMLN